LVVVTPGGILSALMLSFLPQYKQVISRISVFCPVVFAAASTGEGSADLGFNAMVWLHTLHLMLFSPSGMDFGLIVYVLLQYRQVICMTAALGAEGA
jgi:hypothetical protein